MTDKTTVSSKKPECKRFWAVLVEADHRGIKLTSELQEPKNLALYEEFWIATKDFVDNYALNTQTTISKDAKGNIKKIEAGNYYKINCLKETGVVDREDVSQSCIIKIMSHLDAIFMQPLYGKKNQYNYSFVIVNNMVNDFFRKNDQTDSLDAPLCPNDKENSTLYDTIPYGKTPEEICIDNDCRDRLEAIINTTLKPHPARQLAFWSSLFDEKAPRFVFDEITKTDLGSAFKTILNDNLNDIGLEITSNYIADLDMEQLSKDLHLNKNSKEAFTKQLSNLKNRAGNSLRKQISEYYY